VTHEGSREENCEAFVITQALARGCHRPLIPKLNVKRERVLGISEKASGDYQRNGNGNRKSHFFGKVSPEKERR
jgi:hypothetical protein